MALLISTRALGKRKPLLDDFSVPPPGGCHGDDDLRLRDIIEHVVCHEVREFKKRQHDRRFDRVLSDTQIAEAAARGKIDPASKDFNQEVDGDTATANALQAFEDGL